MTQAPPTPPADYPHSEDAISCSQPLTDLIGKNLPTVDQLDEMVKSGVLSADLGERFKAIRQDIDARHIINGARASPIMSGVPGAKGKKRKKSVPCRTMDPKAANPTSTSFDQSQTGWARRMLARDASLYVLPTPTTIGTYLGRPWSWTEEAIVPGGRDLLYMAYTCCACGSVARHRTEDIFLQAVTALQKLVVLADLHANDANWFGEHVRDITHNPTEKQQLARLNWWGLTESNYDNPRVGPWRPTQLGRLALDNQFAIPQGAAFFMPFDPEAGWPEWYFGEPVTCHDILSNSDKFRVGPEQRQKAVDRKCTTLANALLIHKL